MIAGNLTRDPQVRFFANERAVADFGLAINRRWRGSDGEQKEEVTFVDVECWGRTAELVGQYLTKGRNVFIEGALKLDQWEDKDGNRRSRMRVNAQRVDFIGTGQGRDGVDSTQSGGVEVQQGPGPSPAASSMPAASSVPPPADLGDDEPPF